MMRTGVRAPVSSVWTASGDMRLPPGLLLTIGIAVAASQSGAQR